MALYSTDTFTGDGSTVTFTLTFEYISRDHVTVTRIDSSAVKTSLTVIPSGTPTGNQYIWETDSSIKVGTAPTATETLVIERDTPEDQQIVQWNDGSYLISEDLNTSDEQWLYNIQELSDDVADLVANQGILEAPDDGKQYGRESKTWTEIPDIIPAAPTDSKTYGRKNNAWSEALVDSPSDTKIYGRKDAAWVDLSLSYIGDAPNNGTEYVRKSQGWSTLPDIIPAAPSDSKTYGRKSNAWDAVTPEAPKDGMSYGRKDGSWASIPGGIVYKGVINVVTDSAPAGTVVGDLYVNTGTGTVGASWTGISGDAVTGNERVSYTTDNEWVLFGGAPIPDLQDVCDEGSTTTTGITAAGTVTANLFSGPLPYSDLTGTPTIPTNNNQLTNGAGYYKSGDNASLGSVTTSGGLIGDRSSASDAVFQGKLSGVTKSKILADGKAELTDKITVDNDGNDATLWLKNTTGSGTGSEGIINFGATEGAGSIKYTDTGNNDMSFDVGGHEIVRMKSHDPGSAGGDLRMGVGMSSMDAMFCVDDSANFAYESPLGNYSPHIKLEKINTGGTITGRITTDSIEATGSYSGNTDRSGGTVWSIANQGTGLAAYFYNYNSSTDLYINNSSNLASITLSGSTGAITTAGTASFAGGDAQILAGGAALFKGTTDIGNYVAGTSGIRLNSGGSAYFTGSITGAGVIYSYVNSSTPWSALSTTAGFTCSNGTDSTFNADTDGVVRIGGNIGTDNANIKLDGTNGAITAEGDIITSGDVRVPYDGTYGFGATNTGLTLNYIDNSWVQGTFEINELDSGGTKYTHLSIEGNGSTSAATFDGSITAAGNINQGDVDTTTGGFRTSEGSAYLRMGAGRPATAAAFTIYPNNTFSGVGSASISADGNITCSGTVTANGTVLTSDQRFKENITAANPQLADIKALGAQLKNFDWNADAPSSNDTRQLGLIAQEVETVCPGIVKTIARTKQGAELTPEVVVPAVYETRTVPAVLDEEGEVVEAETTEQVLVTEEQVTPATYDEIDDSYKGISHDALIMKLLGAVAELTAKVEALDAAK